MYCHVILDMMHVILEPMGVVPRMVQLFKISHDRKSDTRY